MTRGALLRNPLGYPGGTRPKFDPTHIAARGINPRHGFSVIPGSGNNYVNLLTGARGTIGGTATLIVRKIHGAIGPTNGFTAANSNSISFAGNVTTNDTTATFAAIWYTPTLAASAVICNSSGNSGIEAGITATGFLNFTYPGVGSANPAAATIVINTPYFTIWTRNGATSGFLTLNLATGKFTTQTVADTSAPIAPNGTYAIGGNGGSAHFGTSNIAVAMFAPIYLGVAQMVAFASDPWSFWYPPSVENLISSSLVARVADVLYPQSIM